MPYFKQILSVVAILSVGHIVSAGSVLEILSPAAKETTTSLDLLHVLGKTQFADGIKARVNGSEVPVYSTGLFVFDKLKLSPGENKVALEVINKSGEITSQTVTISFEPELPAVEQSKLTGVNLDSILPLVAVSMPSGEPVNLGFNAESGGTAEVFWNGAWAKLTESEGGRGLYRGTFCISSKISGKINYRFTDKNGKVLFVESKGGIEKWGNEDSPVLLKVKSGSVANVSYGLTEVRLGGPYLAELPSGTVLIASGKIGSDYRVALAPDLEGFVSESSVEVCPTGTVIPRLEFTSVSTSTSLEGNETVSFGFDTSIPFVVREIPSQSTEGKTDAIEIELFGSHAAATWLIHRGAGEVVRSVSIKQEHTDRLKVIVSLADKNLWGYKTEIDKGIFRLTVRKTPDIVKTTGLKGLKVAIEAGHGGPSNLGARGRGGIAEKDVNLAAALKLQEKLEKAGATVFQVRPDDSSMGLGERAEKAIASNADVFISLHSNSAGNRNGYLSVGGASTYYKHEYSEPLAKSILKEVLAGTKLPDFGLIGNFNYSPIRTNTWMPAILVEMGFMSNPKEEALLNEAEFQGKMADAITIGVQNWLNERRGQEASK